MHPRGKGVGDAAVLVRAPAGQGALPEGRRRVRDDAGRVLYRECLVRDNWRRDVCVVYTAEGAASAELAAEGVEAVAGYELRLDKDEGKWGNVVKQVKRNKRIYQASRFIWTIRVC